MPAQPNQAQGAGDEDITVGSLVLRRIQESGLRLHARERQALLALAERRSRERRSMLASNARRSS